MHIVTELYMAVKTLRLAISFIAYAEHRSGESVPTFQRSHCLYGEIRRFGNSPAGPGLPRAHKSRASLMETAKGPMLSP